MSRSVLLVDPDLDALGALASDLRARGFSVFLADDVERALESMNRRRLDAVLCSEMLAESETLVEGIRSNSMLSAVPRFVLVPKDYAGELSAETLRRNPDEIARTLFSLPPAEVRVPTDRRDFRGDLQQVSATDLLQLLNMNRRTGALSITTTWGSGEVRLVEGEVVDAVFRQLEGEKALFRLLGQAEGSFAFTSGAPAPLRRVQTPTRLLLLEGMRQIDEVRERREALHADEDALVLRRPLQGEPEPRVLQVAQALKAPRTLDELLDELPLDDASVLEIVAELLRNDKLRRVQRGALHVGLADSDRMALLASLTRRLKPPGFSGNARLLVVADPQVLTTILHSMKRIDVAIPPAESPPAAPVPFVLVTLRLSEGVELDVVGVPALAAYTPLWGLGLPGGALAINLASTMSEALSEVCSAAGVPLLEAQELVGDFDPANPAQVAMLLQTALDSVGGG